MACGTQFDDLPPSGCLPPLSDQCVYLCGTFIRPLTPEGGVRIGLESTIPGVHSSDLVFPCIERVLGDRSVDPTCPRIPGLRTYTILREEAPWLED